MGPQCFAQEWKHHVDCAGLFCDRAVDASVGSHADVVPSDGRI